jgi:hypothetical protein
MVLNGILYLPDYANSRILGFTTFPTTNNASAAFALGQPGLTTNAVGTGAGQMTRPQSVKAGNGKLLVSDYGNSRVLIWNTPPTTSGAPADVVVGQAGFGTDTKATTRVNRQNY